MHEPAGMGRPAHILLVEDNVDDIELTRLAFAGDRFKVDLHTVQDGVQCMQFLRRQGPYANAPEVDFILLDLNLPLKDGREVLEELDADKILRRIPVVVLTTSQAETDILASYQLKCSSYIVKPVSFPAFAEAIRKLTEYWFTVVVLPPKV